MPPHIEAASKEKGELLGLDSTTTRHRLTHQEAIEDESEEKEEKGVEVVLPDSKTMFTHILQRREAINEGEPVQPLTEKSYDEQREEIAAKIRQKIKQSGIQLESKEEIQIPEEVAHIILGLLECLFQLLQQASESEDQVSSKAFDHAEYSFWMGVCYENNFLAYCAGGSQAQPKENHEHFHTAMSYYKKASLFIPEAFTAWGRVCCKLGNHIEAVQRYQLGVDKNSLTAQLALADMTIEGEAGLDNNFNIGLSLYRRAVSQGSIEALVGICNACMGRTSKDRPVISSSQLLAHIVDPMLEYYDQLFANNSRLNADDTLKALKDLLGDMKTVIKMMEVIHRKEEFELALAMQKEIIRVIKNLLRWLYQEMGKSETPSVIIARMKENVKSIIIEYSDQFCDNPGNHQWLLDPECSVLIVNANVRLAALVLDHSMVDNLSDSKLIKWCDGLTTWWDRLYDGCYNADTWKDQYGAGWEIVVDEASFLRKRSLDLLIKLGMTTLAKVNKAHGVPDFNRVLTFLMTLLVRKNKPSESQVLMNVIYDLVAGILQLTPKILANWTHHNFMIAGREVDKGNPDIIKEFGDIIRQLIGCDAGGLAINKVSSAGGRAKKGRKGVTSTKNKKAKDLQAENDKLFKTTKVWEELNAAGDFLQTLIDENECQLYVPLYRLMLAYKALERCEKQPEELQSVTIIGSINHLSRLSLRYLIEICQPNSMLVSEQPLAFKGDVVKPTAEKVPVPAVAGDEAEESTENTDEKRVDFFIKRIFPFANSLFDLKIRLIIRINDLRLNFWGRKMSCATSHLEIDVFSLDVAQDVCRGALWQIKDALEVHGSESDRTLTDQKCRVEEQQIKLDQLNVRYKQIECENEKKAEKKPFKKKGDKTAVDKHSSNAGKNKEDPRESQDAEKKSASEIAKKKEEEKAVSVITKKIEEEKKAASDSLKHKEEEDKKQKEELVNLFDSCAEMLFSELLTRRLSRYENNNDWKLKPNDTADKRKLKNRLAETCNSLRAHKETYQRLQDSEQTPGDLLGRASKLETQLSYLIKPLPAFLEKFDNYMLADTSEYAKSRGMPKGGGKQKTHIGLHNRNKVDFTASAYRSQAKGGVGSGASPQAKGGVGSGASPQAQAGVGSGSSPQAQGGVGSGASPQAPVEGLAYVSHQAQSGGAANTPQQSVIGSTTGPGVVTPVIKSPGFCHVPPQHCETSPDVLSRDEFFERALTFVSHFSTFSAKDEARAQTMKHVPFIFNLTLRPPCNWECQEPRIWKRWRDQDALPDKTRLFAAECIEILRDHSNHEYERAKSISWWLLLVWRQQLRYLYRSSTGGKATNHRMLREQARQVNIPFMHPTRDCTNQMIGQPDMYWDKAVHVIRRLFPLLAPLSSPDDHSGHVEPKLQWSHQPDVRSGLPQALVEPSVVIPDSYQLKVTFISKSAPGKNDRMRLQFKQASPRHFFSVRGEHDLEINSSVWYPKGLFVPAGGDLDTQHVFTFKQLISQVTKQTSSIIESMQHANFSLMPDSYVSSVLDLFNDTHRYFETRKLELSESRLHLFRLLVSVLDFIKWIISDKDQDSLDARFRLDQCLIRYYQLSSDLMLTDDLSEADLSERKESCDASQLLRAATVTDSNEMFRQRVKRDVTSLSDMAYMRTLVDGPDLDIFDCEFYLVTLDGMGVGQLWQRSSTVKPQVTPTDEEVTANGAAEEVSAEEVSSDGAAEEADVHRFASCL